MQTRIQLKSGSTAWGKWEIESTIEASPEGYTEDVKLPASTRDASLGTLIAMYPKAEIWAGPKKLYPAKRV